jgi:methyltransferase
MGVTVSAYFVLLLTVALLRLVELGISRRNQRLLAAKGVKKVSEPGFRWMVVFHATILTSAGAEVAFLERPFIPLLALFTGPLLALAIGLRWWVIRVMAEHWNVQVMASAGLGVVTEGPFRWIRHPNYAAVFVEMLALPLVHTAWCTALVGSMIHVWVLKERIRVEEASLFSSPAYVALMGWKPRFVPRFFRKEMHPASERLAAKE